MESYMILEKCWSAITAETPDAEVDQHARAILLLSIEDTLIARVKKCKTAKEAWSALEQIYKDRSVAQLIALKRDLYGLSMK